MTLTTVCSYALIRSSIRYLRADSQVALANLAVIQLQCIVLMFSAVLLPQASKLG